MTTNVIIEPTAPARAEVRSYFTVIQQSERVPLQPIIAGRYRDQLVCELGAWRFAERCMLPELFGELTDHLLFDPAPMHAKTIQPKEEHS